MQVTRADNLFRSPTRPTGKMTANIQDPHTAATLDDISNYGHLFVAATLAEHGKTHYDSVCNFEANKSELLHQLSDTLKNGNFKTSPYIKKVIYDEGSQKERTIHKLPFYPDRVVHWAIMLILEPVIMGILTDRTHAAIKGRGQITAKNQVAAAVRGWDDAYCLKIDVEKCFPNTDHVLLKEAYYPMILDYGFRKLVYENIDSLEKGIPIGNYTSQFHENYFLNSLDKWLQSLGFVFVRYMDDVCIFSDSPEKLHRLRRDLEWYLMENLNLPLKKNWQVFPVKARGVDFVGYRVYQNRILLRKTTWLNVRRRALKIRKNVEKRGYITDHERSQLASDMGRVAQCTPAVRRTIYKQCFEPILKNTNIKLKKLRKAYDYH